MDHYFIQVISLCLANSAAYPIATLARNIIPPPPTLGRFVSYYFVLFHLKYLHF